MKKLILLLLIALMTMTQSFVSCSKSEQSTQVVENIQPVVVVKDSVLITKIVKDLKEKVNQNTDYEYKYDWINGRFRQQPKIYTTTNYYCIYKDGTYEEISQDRYFFLNKGDTISYYKQK